jgi:hypothetical protein
VKCLNSTSDSTARLTRGLQRIKRVAQVGADSDVHTHQLLFVSSRYRPYSRNKVVSLILHPALDQLAVKDAALGYTHFATA